MRALAWGVSLRLECVTIPMRLTLPISRTATMDWPRNLLSAAESSDMRPTPIPCCTSEHIAAG